MHAAAMLCIRERVRVPARAILAADIDRPTPRDQRELWRRALSGRAASLNGQIDHIVDQFSLDGSTIKRIGLTIGEPDTLWDEVRTDARPVLDDLAQRLLGQRGWAELVLPSAQTDTLRQIVAHVRHRTRVYEGWGFGRGGRGLGVAVLFSGPSGVGKTLAAEVIASELRLDLYRVDLSQVVSKYIGETEKNLRRVFAAAEGGGAVLLFDEADALFGKRTEVSDSHDRYANIEVSYLLQRMETYRGLAILTTNFKSAIDNAFLRRLRFVVNFPFPNPPERVRIWDAVLPPQLPRDGLDLTRLAQLNAAGGNIRNIALHAGFIAADAGRTVTMADLLRAARAEYAKLELTLSDAEIAGWR
jgi:SpoVK/Ycf46/Vps4 family AAA+-type ATPase